MISTSSCQFTISDVFGKRVHFLFLMYKIIFLTFSSIDFVFLCVCVFFFLSVFWIVTGLPFTVTTIVTFFLSFFLVFIKTGERRFLSTALSLSAFSSIVYL